MRLRRLAGLALAVPVAVYLAICGYMFAVQRSLQYSPNPAAMDPAGAGLAVEVERLVSEDGTPLVAWWAPPRDPAKPVLLYLPGNGSNLMRRADRFGYLIGQGYGLYAVSWRGYGGSEGSPTEAGILADARAAYASVAARTPASRLVIFGESLGTNVAVMLAAEKPAAAILLDSSFSSVRDVAAGKYWWLPVDLLMRDPFRADLAAPRVTAPVLQIHCTDDPVTPLPYAERLNRLLPRADLFRIEARCHPANLLRFEARMREFLSQHGL